MCQGLGAQLAQEEYKLTQSRVGLSLNGPMPLALDLAHRLRQQGIQPSAQRVAVAEYVLQTGDHPSADQVWDRVRHRQGFPMLSRATVYNTLHLFVERGLLREWVVAEGRVVYDPKVEPHHHFIDDDTGEIRDVPWQAVKVKDVEKLPGLEVREYQVVMRGRPTARPRN
jgi:Fe2+ or Zn2+ uptake regulation protein